ncbi:hypothetical protein LEMLEM_LOCUS21582, partial [Lemmus lemmus]
MWYSCRLISLGVAGKRFGTEGQCQPLAAELQKQREYSVADTCQDTREPWVPAPLLSPLVKIRLQ